MSYSQYNQASNSANQYKSEHPPSSNPNTNNGNNDYNNKGGEAYEANQVRYNEAESMQQQRWSDEHEAENQKYNANMSYMNTAESYKEPYGGCCYGSSSGSEAGAAAVGMVAGMAVGSAMKSSQPQQPTTIIENVGAPAPAAPLPVGTTVPTLPAGATPTKVNGEDYYYYNGTYYKPVFNGGQVVYVASAV